MIEDTALIGNWVKVDHPITCLNPTEFFQITKVKISGSPMSPKICVRGENTMWFGIGLIVDWYDRDPEIYNPKIVPTLDEQYEIMEEK